MKILIAGASGFIGTALVARWQSAHSISVLGRDKTKLQSQFPPPVQCLDWKELPSISPQDYDAVINLCGKNIGNHRWTAKVKKALVDSRVNTTNTLIDWMKNSAHKPHFYCANAVGVYGLQEEDDLTSRDESYPVDLTTPKDFLQTIAFQWQRSAERALLYNIPLTIARFGVALKKGEGMLKKLSPSFYFGLGSVLGTGSQAISWIHIDDLVNAFDYLIHHTKGTQEPINFCAPNPIPQGTFARALAKAMNRPLWLTTPSWFIKLIFGEMGECLILKGQRVLPSRLLQSGFQFHYPDIQAALNAEFVKGA